MEAIIEFFENKCLEAKLYWRVKSLPTEAGSEGPAFELEWHRDRKTKWHLRQLPDRPPIGQSQVETPWDIFTAAELPAKLEAHGIDQDNVRQQIESTTLQQVVFAKMMYDDAVEFFGEDVVSGAVAETAEFLLQLRAMVADLTEQDATAASPQSGQDDGKKPPVMRLIKD